MNNAEIFNFVFQYIVSHHIGKLDLYLYGTAKYWYIGWLGNEYIAADVFPRIIVQRNLFCGRGISSVTWKETDELPTSLHFDLFVEYILKTALPPIKLIKK